MLACQLRRDFFGSSSPVIDLIECAGLCKAASRKPRGQPADAPLRQLLWQNSPEHVLNEKHRNDGGD
jgi:hypothetical protein